MNPYEPPKRTELTAGHATRVRRLFDFTVVLFVYGILRVMWEYLGRWNRWGIAFLVIMTVLGWLYSRKERRLSMQ